jgi:hypothetical protein
MASVVRMVDGKVVHDDTLTEMDGKFKVEVLADNSGKWAGNGLVFVNEEEAHEYGKDLYSRWMAVKEYRVISV